MQCKAQQPIINLEDDDGSEIAKAYYKDTNNLLNPFVGTWVLDDGTRYLKIVFQKKTMVDTGNYYEDLLIGEFQYKENGIKLENTLNKLTEVLPNMYHHSIDGNYIRTSLSPFDDFTTNNFWIDLVMSEPNGAATDLNVRLATVNGQEAIQIFKRSGIQSYLVGDPEPSTPNYS
jgi:hypothetical protein